MPTKIKPPARIDTTESADAKPLRKSVLVLKLLGRARGATLAELMELTGWQPHSTRAYLSRLRTKGMTVTREQRKSGEIAYRVGARAATVDAGVDQIASANTGATSSASAEPAAQ
ncbi:MAG: DUF3489 domain-containing protein [Sandarakinorhabdus sp.]|nr:DUF3489 domain-containing protein [Sandarakinorhabdus sp.]